MCMCDWQEENDAGEGCSRWADEQTDAKTERSLEESRKLILQWAYELQSVDKVGMCFKMLKCSFMWPVWKESKSKIKLFWNKRVILLNLLEKLNDLLKKHLRLPVAIFSNDVSLTALAEHPLTSLIIKFQLSQDHPWMKERFDQEEKEDTKQDDDPNEVVEKRIMEWAKELHSVSEVGYQILGFISWWYFSRAYRFITNGAHIDFHDQT